MRRLLIPLGLVLLLAAPALPQAADSSTSVVNGSDMTSITDALQAVSSALADSIASNSAANAASTGSLASPSVTDSASNTNLSNSIPTAPSAPAFPSLSTSGNTGIIDTETGSATIPLINLSVQNAETGEEVAFSVQLLLLLTVLSLAPSILVLMTSFLRVSIVLDFIKRALSLQQVPPNTVLMGISLFLTLYIMWPTFSTVYENSFKPLADGQIGIEQAVTEAEGPLRLFMYAQMQNNPQNIRLFMSMSGLPEPSTLADVPTHVLIPAFILNELTLAFKIGILLYIPFIVIDMVVASALMSMGMMMLPPSMISTPFKLILFILVDGWTLITQQVVGSFL
jgi:flagellar biosynthetic protein FliP